MANFVKIALASEIHEGVGKTFAVNGKSVAVFNVHGKYYAIDSVCGHRGGPLGEGMLDDNIVTCPWHGWQWDVATGKSLFNPNITVKSYPVEVEGNDIKIEMD
jgi:nitrite reductase (NADH) small subunit